VTGPVSISFFVPGIPVSQGSKRAFVIRDKSGRHRPVLTESAKGLPQWRATVALAGRQALMKGNEGATVGWWAKKALLVRLAFYLPRPASLPKKVQDAVKRPDLDKLTRAVLDALTGIVWVDDSQITRLELAKDYAHTPHHNVEVGVAVIVTPVTGERG